MDTRWKRWKGRIGFAVLFIGVSLLISGTVTIGSRMFDNKRCNGKFSVDMEQDYQNTDRFYEFIAYRLENMLYMANGTFGMDHYSYGTSYDYNMEMGYEGAASSSEITIEDPGFYNDEELEELNREYAYSNANDRVTPEKSQKMAQEYNKALQSNKNVLYQITKNGTVLYTNMDSEYVPGTVMPEGYNYMLCFDGKKVQIQKDGKDLDVYGDGIYTDGKAYHVPGYKNYEADDSLSDVKVIMLVEKTPAYYEKLGKQNNTYNNPTTAYDIARNAAYDYNVIKKALIYLLIGLLLVVLSFFIRKWVGQGKAGIAKIQSKIWIEAKLAAVILIGVFFWKHISAWIQYNYAPDFFNYIYERGFEETAYEFTYPLIRDILSNPLLILMLFWTLFFVCLDIIRNHKVKPNGLIIKIFDIMETKSLKLSIAKRQTRRIRIMFSILVAGAVIDLVLIILYSSEKIQQAGLLLTYLVIQAVAICAVIMYAKKVKQQAQDYETLDRKIQQISQGDYHTEDTAYSCDEFYMAENNLNQIKDGMEHAISEQLKSERMKVDLVANVSHDIKTPLTSIISYVEFLKEEENLPDYIKDYIKILDEKSKRLKDMVQDIFAISKATSGQLQVNNEVIDFGKLLNQTLADMDENIAKSDVSIRADIKEHEYYINADGQRMYRVCQNLIQNALKYSLEGSRVFISLKEEAQKACAVFMNISRNEIDKDTDFSERFVRGDKSRTDGGSGLGLSIAKSFTQACGGEFMIETNGDMFTVTIKFARVEGKSAGQTEKTELTEQIEKTE